MSKETAIQHLQEAELKHKICLLLAGKSVKDSVSILESVQREITEQSTVTISKEYLDKQFRGLKRMNEKMYDFTYDSSSE